MSPRLDPVIPVLRMFDLKTTLRFYCDYLGCKVDWPTARAYRDSGEVLTRP